MEQSPARSDRKTWISAGWGVLVAGWLAYFALMAFSVRSAFMHNASAFLALAVCVLVLACALTGWRRREGGHALLLFALLVSPAVWYFAAVAAMTVIAYQAS